MPKQSFFSASAGVICTICRLNRALSAHFMPSTAAEVILRRSPRPLRRGTDPVSASIGHHRAVCAQGEEERVSGAVSTASGRQSLLAFSPAPGARFQAPAYTLRQDIVQVAPVNARSVARRDGACAVGFLCARNRRRSVPGRGSFPMRQTRLPLYIALPVHAAERAVAGKSSGCRGHEQGAVCVFRVAEELLMPFVHTPPGSDAAAMTSPPRHMQRYMRSFRRAGERSANNRLPEACRRSRRTAQDLCSLAYALCAHPWKRLCLHRNTCLEHLKGITLSGL